MSTVKNDTLKKTPKKSPKNISMVTHKEFIKSLHQIKLFENGVIKTMELFRTNMNSLCLKIKKLEGERLDDNEMRQIKKYLPVFNLFAIVLLIIIITINFFIR